MRGRAGPVFAALALLGVLALAVFPTAALLDQRQNGKDLAVQLAALTERNRILEDRTDQLRSNEEIERLARQYNLVKPGEEAYFILPPPGTPAAASPPTPPPTPEAQPPTERSRSLWDRIVSWF